MSNYEDLPCSIYNPGRIVPAEHPQLHPRVIEDLTPQKAIDKEVPEEVRAVSAKKKSCLSTAKSRKEVPAHPALRKKTVAFGKTVNVSQTVEGTSRSAKKANMSATSSPAQKPSENGDDWRKLMKEELDIVRKEMQEETVRRQEELNNQNLNKMQEMMAQFFQQVAVPKAQIAEEKENVQRKEHRPVNNKISIARQIIKQEGRIPPEAIPHLERRIQTDPIFRQQIDDVLADAEYESNRNNYSSSPPIIQDGRYAAGNVTGNPSLMRETLTVERSIRYENGVSSIDSRQWTKERNDTRTTAPERWRNYEPEQPALHSTYQPGNSLSYYPSERRTGYYVQHSSDHEEEEVVDYQEPTGGESAAERQRRIREKYARRK